MKDRCLNPRSEKWSYYGGRGITVCERWLVFANFIADMGPPPFSGATLDRIDNARDYEPGNVRWATRLEQLQNTRKNVRVTVDGQTLTWRAWGRALNVCCASLTYRTKLFDGDRVAAIKSFMVSPAQGGVKLAGRVKKAQGL
jgi:hypothetical protein